MRSLTDDQKGALRELRTLWPDTPLSLIGAAALGIHFPSFHRHTYDLDVSVAATLDEIPSLLGGLEGWQPHPKREHEWLSREGVKVDLVPASPELLAAGYVIWPRSGARMSLLGLRHAFEPTCCVELDTRLTVGVAGAATIALLKMVSYQERPRERTRDLGDIAHILEGYVEDSDPRRFSDDVFSAGVHYEEVSSYILGRDLSRMVNVPERRAIESFIALVQREVDGGIAQAEMLKGSPTAWHRGREELQLRFEALERGLAIR